MVQCAAAHRFMLACRPRVRLWLEDPANIILAHMVRENLRCQYSSFWFRQAPCSGPTDRLRWPALSTAPFPKRSNTATSDMPQHHGRSSSCAHEAERNHVTDQGPQRGGDKPGPSASGPAPTTKVGHEKDAETSNSGLPWKVRTAFGKWWDPKPCMRCKWG